MSDKPEPRIVVGVDCSPASREALRWAVEQARLTGSQVHAVMAWDWPSPFSVAGEVLNENGKPLTVEQTAARRLEEAVEDAVGTEPEGVTVRRRVMQGAPVDVLVEVSEGATLLVVGSRGYGGFKGALLGSVSQHVTQYAHCSVLVVRER